MPFLFRLLGAAPVLLLLGTVSSSAQSAIGGMVLDQDGAAVPGVTVQLLTVHGHELPDEQTVTDAEGRFQLPPVAPGGYLVRVPTKYGFDTYQSQVHIAAGTPPRLLIRLCSAVVVQQVTVKADTSQLSTDAGANQDQVSADAKMLEQVPVFDQDYIAALTPFLDQSGVSTSGVTIVVDGIEMNGTGVSASAIAEAHINNDPYSAETNRPGKGQIEIITKPGSPHFHGTLNFTFRDSLFDAKNYFALTKPFEQKRIYEGSLTGPVGTGQKTSFLLSGSRQEDNLQAVVYAQTPSGLIDQNVPTPLDNTLFAARVARDFSPNHRASLQYNVTDTVTRNQGVGGLVLAQAGVNAQAREDDVIFNDRRILSPTLINQLQLFFEKDHDPTRSAVEAPKIVVDGAFTGGGAQADLYATENNLKINNIVSWTHGHQYIRFGINIPNLSRRAWEDNSNRVGTFNFSSLAAYRQSQPYSFTQQEGVGRVVFWMNEIGSFFQDQVQVKPNFRISLGLRYDWQTYFKSIHDFAPRVSAAYAMPRLKTVIRGGVGIFYDRSGVQPMADLKRYNGLVLRSYTLLNAAYPTPYPPGTDLLQFPTNLVQEDPRAHLPYISNFSLAVEHQLNRSFTVTATYRGTVGVDMFRSRDVNAPLPPVYLEFPSPSLGVVRQIESEGRQIGNALDLSFSAKSSRWFSGMAQYTFSHTDNNTGGITWFPANQYSMAGEYGRADFDQRHRFNLLGTINQDHWLNFGMSVKLYSGMPYTKTSGVDTYNTGLLNARPAGVSRNTLQAGGDAELDLRWSKDYTLARWQHDKGPLFTLAVDAFNVTNRTSFLSYVGNVQSSFFGEPTAAQPARKLQFTGRIQF